MNLVKGVKREITDVKIRSPTSRSPAKVEDNVHTNYFKINNQPIELKVQDSSNVSMNLSNVNQAAKQRGYRMKLDSQEIEAL